MKEETKEDLDKRFENEREVSFWERIFEETVQNLIFKDSVPARTYKEVGEHAGMMAEVAVEERRKFIEKQSK